MTDISKLKFMIDIETTGVNAEYDSLLEIAIVEMSLGEDGKYQIGDCFTHLQRYTLPPTNPWAQRHQADLYERSAKFGVSIPPVHLRDQIRGFLESVTSRYSGRHDNLAKDVIFAGWNLGTFDLQFLTRQGYLVQSFYTPDEQVFGDFHYRTYDICSIVSYLSDVYATPQKEIIRKARSLGGASESTAHAALEDCIDQIKILNGLLEIPTAYRINPHE